MRKAIHDDRGGLLMIKRCPQHGFFRGEHCECGLAGQLILDEARTEQLGRLVAGGLRHFPLDLGLEMDSRGWVDLSRLGEVVQKRHRWANKEMVVALVQSDPKQRYEISNQRIRARYGHSMDIELDHPECHLPRLYYGASEEEADRILEIGLKSASQRYVHLSTTPNKAWEVAGYRTGNPRVIQVDAAPARVAGVKMMTVNDDIVISEMIPAPFLCILASKDIPGREKK
jgi:putative RNA 2'-phosphotransferase